MLQAELRSLFAKFKYVETASVSRPVGQMAGRSAAEHVPLAKAIFRPVFLNKLHLDNDYTYFKTVLFTQMPVK
jgi:hypothetical protein